VTGIGGTFLFRAIGNTIFAAVVMAASIYLWFVADSFPPFERYGDVDSDFWPKIILVVIGLVAAVILVSSIRQLRLYLETRSGRTRSPNSPGVARFLMGKNVILVALTLSYLYAFQLLGFIVATFIFLLLATALLGVRHKVAIVLFPLLFTSGLMLLFTRVLNLPLPRGEGIMRDLSLWFY